MAIGRPLKYEPLRRHLAGLPPEVETVTLTVPGIEALVGAPLPVTARLRTWWGNGLASRPQARAWLDAGWWVAALFMQHGVSTVTFTRVDSTT